MGIARPDGLGITISRLPQELRVRPLSRETGLRLLGLLWIVDGVLEILPGTAKSFIDIIKQNAEGQPAWLHSVMLWGAGLMSPHALLWNDLLGVVEYGVGLLLLLGMYRRPALVASIALALLIWIWGQAFGLVLTGSATDPGAMPLYILAALLVWPARTTTRESSW